MEKWKGRVALVTGASSGIGAGVSRRLVHSGLTVIGCARRLHDLQELQEDVKGCPGKFHPIKCDLRQEGDILAMFDVIKQEHGGLDVCINNAGVIKNTSLSGGETEDWREEWQVNVMARCICSRETLKSMKDKGVDDGHIIDINSVGSHILPTILPHYVATKWAAQALTLGLRHELRQAKSHIRMTAISPSVTDSGIFNTISQGDTGARALFETNPHLAVQDVADAVEYVLSAPPHVEVHDIILAHTEDMLRTKGHLN